MNRRSLCRKSRSLSSMIDPFFKEARLIAGSEISRERYSGAALSLQRTGVELREYSSICFECIGGNGVESKESDEREASSNERKSGGLE